MSTWVTPKLFLQLTILVPDVGDSWQQIVIMKHSRGSFDSFTSNLLIQLIVLLDMNF